MTKKISDILLNLFTKSLVWFVLIIWHLLDSSNYEAHLFIGNLFASLFIIGIITLITNRLSFSVLLTLALESILNFACAIKAEFFSTVLTYYDLIFLLNIYHLSGEDFVFSYLTMSFVIYTIIVFALITYLFFKTPVLIKVNHYVRMIMLLVAIFVFKLSFHNLRDDRSYLHTWLSNTRMENIKNCNQMIPAQNMERALCYSLGPFLDIISGIAENKIKSADPISNSDLIKSKVSELAYVSSKKIKDFPNIILVLNESTFDPSYLDYKFASNLKFDFFHSTDYLKGNGILKVHTFGGGSSLSEFPSVTGIIHDIFIGPVTYPFLNVADITKSSIFRELKKIGYYSIVIYPQDKKFINAEYAFKVLGADRVVGTNDYGYKPQEWREISEKMISEMIDQEIAKAPADMPIFVSVATIRNHGPHSREIEDKVGCKDDMTDIMCSKLNDYMKKLAETDKDWMEYTNRIMRAEKKTIMIHFGDHLPSFEGEMDELKFKYPDITSQDIYRTFYNIRANFDMENYSYPVLDISYFPSLILDIVGANDSLFYRASSFIRNKCNGLLMDCASLEPDLLRSYKSLITEQLELHYIH